MRNNSMIRITERSLYVPLDKKEAEEQGKVLLDLLNENDRIEAEKKLAMDRFKGALSEKHDEISQTRHALEHGVLQKVGVTEYLSEDMREVYTVRNDTGEEFERRPATEADKQTVLAL